MKKITLMLVALLAAFAANAWTVSFTNPENWSTVYCYAFNGAGEVLGKWPGTAMTKSSDGDVWTITSDKSLPGNVVFNNGSSKTGDLTFKEGATYNMTGEEGAEQKITYWIHGQITGVASWTGIELTKDSNNVWSTTQDFVKGDFGIKQMTNESQTAWYGWDKLGTPKDNCAQSGSNINLTAAGNYTISFDPATSTISVKLNKVEEPSQDVIIYAIHGNILTGNANNWTTQNLTESNGVWSYTGNVFKGQFGIQKLTNGDSKNSWFTTLGTPADNCSIVNDNDGHTNVSLSADGNYTFTYDPTNNILTVKLNNEEEDPNPPTPSDIYNGWYVNLCGTYNNFGNNGVQLKDGNTIAKWENVALGNGEVEIKVWNGSADTYYGLPNTPAIETNTWVTLQAGGGQHFTIKCASANENFDVEFNMASLEIKVSKLGVESAVSSVEAANGEAVYFNMQGVRVANPENGLFIRVQNGKAVKVVK